MAAYLDTSVLVALFFHEPGSATARSRISLEPDVWVSRWTLAEFASAAAFRIRGGQTAEPVARKAARRLARLVDGGDIALLEIERGDLSRCAQLCAAHASGLRTPEALHAAVAARGGLVLLTFDTAQARGCSYHGIEHQLLAPA